MDAEAWATYRAELLTLAGDDDPADVQAGTPAELRERVRAAGEHLRSRPEPREWSVQSLVGHFADAELMASARYRWILSHDRPGLAAYDQDLFADALRYDDSDVEVMLGMFEALRAANLELWARTNEEQRTREGIHAERGPSSYDTLFREVAGHDRFHLAQIDRTLAAVMA